MGTTAANGCQQLDSDVCHAFEGFYVLFVCIFWVEVMMCMRAIDNANGSQWLIAEERDIILQFYALCLFDCLQIVQTPTKG